jgi:DNA-binding transcriptional MocR family regulator
MFAARRRFADFIRLNRGHPWTPAMDRAIARLGDILRGF